MISSTRTRPTTSEFTKYAKEDFSWADQVRLAEFLAAHEGPRRALEPGDR